MTVAEIPATIALARAKSGRSPGLQFLLVLQPGTRNDQVSGPVHAARGCCRDLCWTLTASWQFAFGTMTCHRFLGTVVHRRCSVERYAGLAGRPMTARISQAKTGFAILPHVAFPRKQSRRPTKVVGQVCNLPKTRKKRQVRQTCPRQNGTFVGRVFQR